LIAPILGNIFSDGEWDFRSVAENFVKHESFHSYEGLRKESKIVGGLRSAKERYPYQVALFRGDTQFCGGTLISPTWVLTAAHCYGIGLHVEIGRYDLSDESEIYEKIGIKHEIPHPDFEMDTLDYDIMLVELESPSDYQPIKLDDGSQSFTDGMDLTVIGWGKTSTWGRESDILLETEVDYMLRDTCKKRYFFLGAEITDRMICASRPGRDACQGDSGGPLIIKGFDSSEDVQVGVVSWGIGCGLRLIPGVYSTVAKALDFIDMHVLDR